MFIIEDTLQGLYALVSLPQRISLMNGHGLFKKGLKNVYKLCDSYSTRTLHQSLGFVMDSKIALLCFCRYTKYSSSVLLFFVFVFFFVLR